MGAMKAMIFCLITVSLFGVSVSAKMGDGDKPGSDSEASGAIVQNQNNSMDMSIAKSGHDAFMKAPGLTSDQREKLSQILNSTMNQAGKIRMEIAAQKIDFFAALTEGNSNPAKIKQIKKKIMDLDSERLNIMFKAMDEVQKVLGKNPEAGKYLRDLMREHLPPGERNI